MRAIPIHTQDEQGLQSFLPEAVSTVQCCLVVTCRHADVVLLAGDICEEHDALLFNEASPGIWIVWLMLRPGAHYGTVETRGAGGRPDRTGRFCIVHRQAFALTIPDSCQQEPFVAELWLVRNSDASGTGHLPNE